jgi:hypothetical protein
MLKEADEQSVHHLRHLLRDMLFERLASLGLARITLDFDGSVQSTRRHAEGTAVGYNKKRKGERSYYPLFCTIAQTAQVLDFLHRSGNVHDSQGAQEFILACVQAAREALPGIIVEARMDSAFFSDAIVSALQDAGIEFTISVPFERFTELKRMIEQRRRWQHISADVSCFEDDWKPKVWDRRFRFLSSGPGPCVSTGNLQLDCSSPRSRLQGDRHNKMLAAGHVVATTPRPGKAS